jgi:hypothetical protein
MNSVLGTCRALVTRMPSRRREDPPPYGWDRISAGAGVLDALDPGWWRDDAAPPVDVAALDMADHHACVLGQRYAWAAEIFPRPYEAGLLVLGVPSGDAAGYGFTGVDADLLTPGWRRLISARRAPTGRSVNGAEEARADRS